MPADLIIDNSISPSSGVSGNKAGDGPKYNDDVNLLDSEDSLLSDENKDDDTDDKDSKKDNKDKKDKNDIIEDDDKDDDNKEDKEDKNENDEDDEDDENEINDEDDEKEVNIPFDRPTVREIKAKYPELFKDFPQLKESFFRELAFTKLFPTVEDAQEAFDDNEAFSTLTESILSGDPAPLLDSVEKADAKALEIMALSFLPSLYKKNQDLYAQTVTPIFQNLIRTLFNHKDENTKNAALVLADYIFGSDGEAVAKGEKSAAKSIKPTEEQERIKTEKEDRLTQAFRTSAGKVQQNVTNSLESLVLKNHSFDPDKVFSPFLRKQGAKEVIARIMKQLESDESHMRVMSARWKRARANGYTNDDESKIVSTYLARAKSLIPNACSKVSAAMLGTKVKAADNKRVRTEPVRKENNSGRSSSSNGKSAVKVDYNKMSDMDILNT